MKRKLFVLLALGLLSFLFPTAFAQSGRSLLAYEVRWSPDGRWIGVGSFDGGWIFDAQDFDAAPLHYFEGSIVYAVEFDPLHPHAAFAPADGQLVRVLEIESGQKVYDVSAPMADGEFFSVYYDLRYDGNGRYLSAVNTSLLYVFDAATGERLQTLSDPDPDDQFTGNWLTAIDYGNRVGVVMVTDWNGRLLEYDLDDPPQPTEHPLGTSYGMERFETIPGTSRVLFLDVGAFYTYDLVADRVAPLNLESGQRFYGFDLSPDGERVAMGAETDWYVYDLVGDAIIRTFESEFDQPGDLHRIYSLAFSPEGDYVATLQTDGQLKVWDVISGEVIAQLGDFDGGVSQRWG